MARLTAARAVNAELVGLYWDIGKAIRQKQSTQGWGDSVVERFARDLKRAFPGTTGRNEYFIDLLFYHRFLKALVAVELKTGKFEPEHAGKMDFYLNVLNEKERAPSDAPSIGIILCAEKDNLEVEFALKSKANPIGVAEYQLQAALPARLRGKLPTAQQLEQAMREAWPGRR